MQKNTGVQYIISDVVNKYVNGIDSERVRMGLTFFERFLNKFLLFVKTKNNQKNDKYF